MRTRTTPTLRPFGAYASGPMPTAAALVTHSAGMERGAPATGLGAATAQREPWVSKEPGAGEMACPVCGHPMPDLKGGKATICPVCGFKDSCCY